MEILNANLKIGRKRECFARFADRRKNDEILF